MVKKFLLLFLILSNSKTYTFPNWPKKNAPLLLFKFKRKIEDSLVNGHDTLTKTTSKEIELYLKDTSENRFTEYLDNEKEKVRIQYVFFSADFIISSFFCMYISLCTGLQLQKHTFTISLFCALGSAVISAAALNEAHSLFLIKKQKEFEDSTII